MTRHARKLLAQIALVLLVLSGVVPLQPAPASANTGGYPYAHYNGPGSNPSESVWTDGTGHPYSPYLHVYRNCTDFAAWKLDAANGFRLPFHGHAKDWGPKATSLGYTVNMTPARGAVAWWNGQSWNGWYGHVAWVSAVNGDGTVTIEEYNVPAGSGNYNVRAVPAGSVSGYIHFKDIASGGSGSSSDNNPSLNGDARADLAWFHSPKLHLLTGQANGKFSVAGSNPANAPIGTPTWAGDGDVTGNGKAEVIWHQNGILFTLRWAGGGWQIVNQTSGIGVPDRAAAGDFNGDGRTDLAWFHTPILHLLLGQANGKFAHGGSNPASAPIGLSTWAGAGDVNGDGRDEVIWHQNGSLFTLRWSGSTWQSIGQTSGIGVPGTAAVGDFNKDGRADLAWYHNPKLYLLTGQPNGRFGNAGSNPASAPIGAPNWTGGGDVNGDGKDDVIWYQNGTLFVLHWVSSAGKWGILNQTGGIGMPGVAVSSG